MQVRELMITFFLVVCPSGYGLGYGPKDAVEDLRSDDTDSRIKGANYFSSHPDKCTPAAGEALLEALGKPETRFYVIHALSACKVKEAVGPLLTLLEQNPPEWASIADALASIGDKKSVPRLINMLEDVRVNRGAIVTLGKLGDRRAVVPLLKMLEDRPGEYTVLGALADIGDRRALGPLMGLARKTLTKQIQGDLLNTTRALARLADGSVTPLLIQLSKHPDGAVRQVAAEGLGRVGDKEAVARLREMLKHEKDKDAKTGAITGLATCDTEQTVRMLSEELKALTDWELAGERNMAYVREAAWHRNIVKGLARTRRASALVAVIERVRTWQDVDRGWFSRDEFHSLVTTMHRDLEAAAYLTGKVTIRKGLDKIMRSRASSGALARKYLKHADELLVWWGENETGVRKLAAQGKKLPYAQRPD